MKHSSILLFLILFLPLNFLTVSCDSDEPGDGIYPPVPDAGSTLKDASPYPFGAALNINNFKNIQSYDSIVKKEFSSITAENAMKMSAIAPARDRYYWDDADLLASFAKENNIRLHGHCLVWHQGLPGWINSYNGTKEEWKILMKDYITVVMSRYKGRVASWDVVNEALLDDGKPRTESIWYKKIGWEYVELAFRYAHQADPDAVLFYNDYGQEYSNVKLTAINDTVRNMINRGVPIHGIGMQMHTHINHPANQLANAINQTALLTGENGQKMKVHVSELDIALNPDSKKEYVVTTSDLEAQKVRYRMVAAAMRAIPEEQQWGVTTWGVIDSESWLKDKPDFPLLFDKNYKRKPCHRGILEALVIK